MNVDMHIDWQRETARFDWGAGAYALVCHRVGGEEPRYEIVAPGGKVTRVGGFRRGVRALFDAMMRECG
jgi:hypothetical protein